MPIYISMLRGINVSGQKKIKMKELHALYVSLGFKNVHTYIQSGNVVFESEEENVTTVAEKIEHKISETYGFQVAAFLRSPDDMQRVLENNPFLTENVDTKALYVTFLSGKPDPGSLKNLETVNDEPDEFSVRDREVYVYCPGGYGKTKLSNTFFEKKLSVLATTRNWKTVNTLVDMAAEIIS